MTTIRYDILTGTHYSSNAGTTLYRNGFPDGVLDTGSDTALKAHCEKHLTNLPMDCATTGKFLWNGVTYYASAKTLQQIEKKFTIKTVFSDKDLKKKEVEVAEKLKKLMATEEWLENKILDDSGELFRSGLKRNAFVQRIREMNVGIAHTRITRVTQKFFTDELWTIGDRDSVESGSKSPKEKLPKEQTIEAPPLQKRRKRR